MHFRYNSSDSLRTASFTIFKDNARFELESAALVHFIWNTCILHISSWTHFNQQSWSLDLSSKSYERQTTTFYCYEIQHSFLNWFSSSKQKIWPTEDYFVRKLNIISSRFTVFHESTHKHIRIISENGIVIMMAIIQKDLTRKPQLLQRGVAVWYYWHTFTFNT